MKAWKCRRDRHCGVLLMEHRTLYLKITMCSVVQSTVHNTTTGCSSYETSPPKLKRKSIIHEQFSKVTMHRIYDSVEIVKKIVAATARKCKTSPGKLRQIGKARERGGTIENRHARIREHMYTNFRNARNVGNAIHYRHLNTWAKEAAILMGIPRFKYPQLVSNTRSGRGMRCDEAPIL